MKIRFLGTHNAESKGSRMVTFLVDDIICVEAGCLTSELSFPEQRKIRAILLSHGHYDHIRDIPALAFNNTGNGSKPAPLVLGTSETLRILESHLIDGTIYPEFAESHSYLGRPALDLRTIEPYKRQYIEGYQVRPLPVKHTIDAVGFEISSTQGTSLFYTGDTCPGLSEVWKDISPQLLIMDTTLPSRMKDTAGHGGHICPETLKQELMEFRRIKEYLPKVALVHMCPEFELEVREEVKLLERELETSITVSSEGDELYV